MYKEGFRIEKYRAEPWRNKYDFVDDNRFDDTGMATVRKDKKSGVVNKDGIEIIPLNLYDGVYINYDGSIQVELNGRYGMVDKKGNRIIDIKYDNLIPHQGYYIAKLNGKWGYIDKNGNILIDFKYDSAEAFSDEYARVSRNGKWGFIDKNGNILVDFKYDDVSGFHNGYAYVILNGKYGFVNTSGRLIIPCEYDDVHGFFEDKSFDNNRTKFGAQVKKGRWWYIINTNNEIVSDKWKAND
jgi:hypothetical protein